MRKELVLSQNNFLNSKINTTPLKILTLVLLSILLYATNNAYIYFCGLAPFGVGLVFALLYIDFNGVILGIIYAITFLISSFNLNGLIVSINVALVLFLVEYLRARKPKKEKAKQFKLNKVNVFIFAGLSLVSYIVTNLQNFSLILALFVSIILGMFFLYSCIVFFSATFGRGMLCKLNLDEKICGAVILIIFSIGIAGATIFKINLGFLFCMLIILLSTYLTSVGVTMVVATLLGMGLSIYFFQPVYISLFLIVALSSLAFKSNLKLFSVLSAILSYIIFTLIFSLGFSVRELVSVCIGGVFFILVPSKLLNKVSTIFESSKPIAIQNLITLSKNQMVGKVKDLSHIFSEMDKVYRNMVKGVLNKDESTKLLKDELLSGVCKSCENYNNCFRSNSFMDDVITNLIASSYEKGKVILPNIPEYLSSNCQKFSVLINYLNGLLSTYLDYRNSISNLDSSRLLIADQLDGISKLLLALSTDLNQTILINNKFEKRIKENLSYAQIICLECVMYEKSASDCTINIIVKKSTYDDKNIEKIISKTLQRKFKIESISDSEVIGADSIILKSGVKYDIAFGSAVATKSGGIYSGDNHSVVSLGDGKYMVSICDGMGSGSKANSISKLSCSLIENFYRAGFDNDIILSSVNKLLSLSEEENFSTIDLCVIDGKKCIYDFIKLGATTGYIKHADGGVDTISSSGLPIGVLENIKPHITKKTIMPMDMIILVSDGISDALGDELFGIIKQNDTINPQTLSEEILNCALDTKMGIAEDDMTCVCVRVFENV